MSVNGTQTSTIVRNVLLDIALKSCSQQVAACVRMRLRELGKYNATLASSGKLYTPTFIEKIRMEVIQELTVESLRQQEEENKQSLLRLKAIQELTVECLRQEEKEDRLLFAKVRR